MKRACRLALVIVAAAQIVVAYRLLGERTIDRAGDLAGALAVVVGFGQGVGIATARAGRSGLGLAVQALAIALPLTLLRGYEPALYVAWLALLTLPGAVALAAASDVLGPGSRRLIAVVVAGPALALAVVGAAARMTSTRPTDAWSALAAGAALLGSSAAAVVVVGAIRSPAPRPLRRAVLVAIGAPASGWAIATAALVATAIRNVQTFEQTAIVFVSGRTTWVYVLSVLQLMSLGALLVGIFWRQVLDPHLRRSDIDAAGAILTPAGIVRHVRTALADPSSQVLYRSEIGGWIDSDGAVVLVGSADQRLLTVVADGPEVLGAIACDRSLASERETVELVASTIGLGLRAGRQVARARHQAEQARQLTARLVVTADEARHQLLDELRDGPLQLLAAVEDRVASDGDLSEVASMLKDVTEQVRAISHGLIPAALERGGLAAALTEAEVVPRRRLPPAIEVTAFLAADGDPGASLRDDGDTLTITLGTAPRDPMLLDRISVLDGSVTDRTITIPLVG